MRFEYSELLEFLEHKYDIYEEEDHLYFMPNNYVCQHDMLIQELEDSIVVWNNDIDEIAEKDMYSVLSNSTKKDIIFPYVDSDVLHNLLIEMDAEPVDFEDEDGEYENHYGSYILRFMEA